MDSYPPEYLYHLTQFVAVCGLDPKAPDTFAGQGISDNPLKQTSEPVIKSSEPVIEHSLAASLMTKFNDKSKHLQLWEPLAAKASARQVNHFLRVMFLERNFSLPVVKDRSSGTPDDEYLYSNGDAHSAISPRNPKSALYPDGLFTHHWVQKYLYVLPSTVVSFYQLNSSPEYDSQLASELSLLKKNLLKRNIKLIAIVVFEEDEEGNAKTVSDRIYNLRKSSGLQPRTGLLSIAHKSNDTEKETLVETICQLAYSESMEFYTNISKSLRKRKGKSHLLAAQDELDRPPLSTAGWDVRYNVKLAILAELRQDLDFSLNCYETAYDSILELFVVLSPSSPTNNNNNSAQWNQARQLLDMVAFKIVRICMYQKRTTSAYKKFQIHIQSVTGILNQKGLDKHTYQYVYWLARQYELLANLVSSSEDYVIPKDRSLSTASDDSIPGARLPSAGFLYLEVAELSQGLSQLPRSEDTYMASDENHEDSTRRLLQLAAERFSSHHENENLSASDLTASTAQKRSIAYTFYQLGDRYASSKDYTTALKYYKAAVSIYSSEKWTFLSELLLTKIVECSSKLANDNERGLSLLQLALVTRNSKVQSDDTLVEHLKNLSVKEKGDDEAIDLGDIPYDVLEYGFTFQTDTLYCGSEYYYQLYLNPLVTTGSLILETVTIEFEGLPNITIKHNGSSANKPHANDQTTNEISSVDIVDLTESTETCLEFSAYQPKVLILKSMLTAAGEAKVKTITASVAVKVNRTTLKGSTTVKTLSPEYSKSRAVPWYSIKSPKRHVLIEHLGTASILPRPARLKVTQSISYVLTPGETVPVAIEVENQEAEGIKLSVQASINATEGEDVIAIEWLDSNENVAIESGQSKVFSMQFQVPYIASQSLNFELVASYVVGDDNEEVIRDVTSHFIEIGKPFRVNFVLSPIAHSDDWPSMFVPDTIEDAIPLIVKRWDLSAMLLYLGEDRIQVTGSELRVKSEDGSECQLVDDNQKDSQVGLGYNENHTLSFIFDCWKRSATEARGITAEAELIIHWKRQFTNADGSVKESLPTNQLKLPSVKLTLPLYEPRVILDLKKLGNTVELMYYIENATSHILTYTATMGSSPFFAYQGPKMSSLRLLPYSRRTLKYNLVALKKDASAVLPPLKVHDTYYKRTLVIVPANKAIRQDRSDLLVSTED